MKKLLVVGFILSLCTLKCFAYDVSYNTKTNKYHYTHCHLIKNCTNCVVIDINEAIEKKADPCEVCRTSFDNTIDYINYKRKKRQEQKELEKTTPGVKHGSNFTYTVK